MELEPYQQRVSDFEAIAKLSVGELHRRLEADASSFSIGQLTRIAVESAKLLLKAQQEVSGKAKPTVQTFIQIVSHPGIPEDKREEVLLGGIKEIEKAKGDASVLRKMLVDQVGYGEAERLLGEVSNGKGKVHKSSSSSALS
jgi:hypothetical protein